MMSERPISFTGFSMMKLMKGLKTQTRRVIVPQPILVDGRTWEWPHRTIHPLPDGVRATRAALRKYHAWASWAAGLRDSESMTRFCRHGQPGDVLWCRERVIIRDDGTILYQSPAAVGRIVDGVLAGPPVPVDAHNLRPGERWRPAMLMPRRAARLLLDVLSVRAEPLLAITESDACAEGVSGPGPGVVLSGERAGLPGYSVVGDGVGIGTFPSARCAYFFLWDAINRDRGYPMAGDPWVWRIEFCMHGSGMRPMQPLPDDTEA